jgi:hypothetical protein
LRGLVVTTQRATVINLDARGEPLRPAIVWLDQRRSDADPKLAWWWELALRAVRMRDTVRYFAREAEANWIAQHQPALWARTGEIPAAVGLPELALHRAFRRFRREPGRLHPIRLSSRALGTSLELEMAMPAGPARDASGTCSRPALGWAR